MEGVTYEQLFDALRREKSRDELQKLEPGFYAHVRRFLDEKKEAMLSAHAQGYAGLGAQRASIEYQNTKRLVRELYERRERKIVTLALHRTRTESAIVDLSSLLPEEHVLFTALVENLTQTKEQVFAAVGVESTMASAASSTLVDREETPVMSRSRDTTESTMDDAPSFSYTRSHSSDGSDTQEESYGGAYGPSSTPTSSQHAMLVPMGHVRIEVISAIPKVMGANGTVYGPFSTGEKVILPEDIASILIKKGRVKSA